MCFCGSRQFALNYIGIWPTLCMYASTFKCLALSTHVECPFRVYVHSSAGRQTKTTQDMVLSGDTAVANELGTNALRGGLI